MTTAVHLAGRPDIDNLLSMMEHPHLDAALLLGDIHPHRPLLRDIGFAPCPDIGQMTNAL